jgi:hypothetical protein
MLKKNVGATVFAGRIVAFTAEAIEELAKGGAVAEQASRGLNLRGGYQLEGQGSAKRCTGDPKRLRKMTIG